MGFHKQTETSQCRFLDRSRSSQCRPSGACARAPSSAGRASVDSKADIQRFKTGFEVTWVLGTELSCRGKETKHVTKGVHVTAD